jgi:polysaccharide biosynthesis/export protein
MYVPENASPAFSPEQNAGGKAPVAHETKAQSYQTNHCAPPGTTSFMVPGTATNRRTPSNLLVMRYSTGDRFNLQVPGAAEFSGDYVVNADGRVMLPFAEPIIAIGLTNEALAQRIERSLVRAKLFESSDFRVSVRPVQYSAINVTVSGAVFLPGRFTINHREPDKPEKVLARSGDSPMERFLAAAVRAAGGVRPDADLSRIMLHRDGQKHRLDWRGALTGARVDDVALLEGDHIHVEEAGCFQSALVRHSQLSPLGVRVFISNLTTPGISSISMSQHATNLPYGTRLLSALVSGNCVGGSRATNARRYGVLISRNPRTLETQVIQRSIEELILSADRDSINPFLMPDDAIACYDSAATDAKEVSSLLHAILLPFNTGANTAAAITSAIRN